MRAILAACLVVAATVGAEAQDWVPDFTGKWSGSFDIIRIGRDTGSKGEIEKVTVTYDLTDQRGRLIWGTVSSDMTDTRPIVLAFSLNNGTMVGSDTEGLHRITVITLTTLEICFTDNGTGSIVATCGIVERAQ